MTADAEAASVFGKMGNNSNKAVAMKGLTLSLLHLPFAFAFCISNLNFLPKFG